MKLVYTDFYTKEDFLVPEWDFHQSLFYQMYSYLTEESWSGLISDFAYWTRYLIVGHNSAHNALLKLMCFTWILRCVSRQYNAKQDCNFTMGKSLKTNDINVFNIVCFYTFYYCCSLTFMLWFIWQVSIMAVSWNECWLKGPKSKLLFPLFLRYILFLATQIWSTVGYTSKQRNG